MQNQSTLKITKYFYNNFARNNQYKIFKSNYLYVIFSMFAVAQTDLYDGCSFKNWLRKK